jgi:cellulose synthase operon protein C
MASSPRRAKHRLLKILALFCACATPLFSVTSNEQVLTLLEASRACTGDLCRFQTIQKALAVDPHSVDAHGALGDYYLSREQFVAARSEFAIALAEDASDWHARKQLAELDLGDGNTTRALAELHKLELEQTGNADLQRELAATYERMGYIVDARRIAMAALRAHPKDPNLQAITLRLAKRQRDSLGMASIYEIIYAADPKDSEAVIRQSQLVRDRGDGHAAEQILTRALASDPSSQQIRAALESLTNKPANIDHLAGESARLHEAWISNTLDVSDPDSSYLSNVDSTIRSAPSHLSADSDAMLLADVRIDRVGTTGLATSHVQQVILIGSDAGVRRYSSRSVQYAPSSENISIVRARLHKPDGRVVEAEDTGDERVADRASAMYYDVRSRVVRYPGAEPGDIVELEYKIIPVTDANPYGNYFASMQNFRGPVATKLKRYVVVTDSHREIYISGQSMPRLQSSDANGERTYRWEAADLAPLVSEPLGPPSTELSPYVHVSTIRDMDALGHWYSAMLTPQLALSPELKQKAAQIESTYRDPLDRIRAVYRFVLTSTHYVALEFGIYSYKPYPVADVYQRRFGDCKDKASLMIAMLRAVGVPSDFVLVRTRPLGSIVPGAASIALFNHAIAYVPQYDLWLDGTADYYGLRELPLDDQGAMALTIDFNGTAQLRTIPITHPLDNITSRTVQAVIKPNGVIDFTGTSTTRGEDAPALRRDYEVQERQQESMRRGLAEVFPTVKLDNVAVEAADSDHPVQVRFAGTLDLFQGQHTIDLRTTWMQRDYLQKLALLSSRSQDVQLGSPWTTQEEFHFRLPAGAEVSQLPADSTLKTSFGTAHIHFANVNREIVIRSEVQFVRTRIEASEYTQFRSFCANLEQAFRREIKVVLR